MRRALISTCVSVIVVGGVATACVPDTAGPSPSSAASARPAVANASADASRPSTVAAARTLIPDGPAHWRSVPREQNGFHAVVDGLCSQLLASRVGKDIVIHYGGNHSIYMDGKRQGDASFMALRDDGLESIGDPHIASPTGVAGKSLDDFWIADSTNSRSSEGAVLHRYVDGKWKTYEKDQTNIHAWLDGGVIGTLGFAITNGDVWVEGSSTKPPRQLWADLPFPSLAAFPTGDVLVISRRNWTTDGVGPLTARHWSPTKKLSTHSLDKMLPDESGTFFVTEIAPDEVYVSNASRTVRWDGESFHALARTTKAEGIANVRRAGSDDLWVLTEPGNLQRVTAQTATPIPTPEPVVAVDGVEHGRPWIVGKSGKLYKRDGEEWKTVTLPAPTFSAGGATVKAKNVLVAGPDDVLITTAYWEKALGWKDQELHTALYRTKPVTETLRCNEPDPENNNIYLGRGFQSWPPTATAECKTPFVVLARRSNATKTVDDWPRLRGAFKGHKELNEITLVEFVSGDRTFVGTKAKDLETAKTIVQVATKNDRLRPEIVCGDPDPKRSLALDLATGTATVK